MSDNLASLLRTQFGTLRQAGAALDMGEDRERRLLLVPERDWSDWSAFLRDGPLPTVPNAPTMLRRLGAATFRVASIASRRAILAPVQCAA